MSVFASIPVLIIMAALICIPFIVGVYVYRDAKRRNMNALLWALVAALAPTLIGVIVYLLVRSNYSDLKCPLCDAAVTEQYVVCPKCGAKLRPSCPNCSMPVEDDWNVCPRCTHALPHPQTDIHTPVRAKDTPLTKTLAIVLIIPILLIVLLTVARSGYSSGGSSGFRAAGVQEYFDEMRSESVAVADKVKLWLDTLDASTDHAYALRYTHSRNDTTEHFFLVYVPGTDELAHSGFGQSSNIFGTTLTLNAQYTGKGGALFSVISSADNVPNLKVKLDDKFIPCQITDVDYNPTLFYIVPQYDELEPGTVEVFLPERISVVKLVSNHNEGVVEITDGDTALKLLSCIDGAPYLDLEHDIYGNPDGTGGYDFKDGFHIVIEYKVRDNLVLHGDMIDCLVFEQDGQYYLIDDRPDNGRIFRQIDADFYHELEALFA